MPIEAYFPAKPGDPILAETWNSLQTTVRGAIDDINTKLAKRLSVAGIDSNGAIKFIGTGVIQRGAATLDAKTTDLGLYSTDPGAAVRVVTNNADIKFYGDGGGGTTPTLVIAPVGDMTLKGRLTATNLTASGATAVQALTATTLTVSGATAVQALTATNITASGATAVQALTATNLTASGATAVQALTAASLTVSGNTAVQALTASGATAVKALTATTLTVSGATAVQAHTATTLTVSGNTTTQALTVSGTTAVQALTAASLTVSGSVKMTGSGVIQRGENTLPIGTSDLGLYSNVKDSWIRIVSNQAPIKFFSDANTTPGGSTVNFGIEANGDATLRGRLTSNGLKLALGGEATKIIDDMADPSSATALPTGKALRNYVNAAIPDGAILMWSGTTIPTGWLLCNGSNGTPDLRDRFIVGSGLNYPIKSTGGAATVTLDKTHMPKHNHGLSTDGAHTHSFVIDNDNGGSFAKEYMLTAPWNSSTGNNQVTTSAAGGHSHTVHESGEGKPHENRPPYYALAFIMRKAT
jgi:microcystin-dependent protein